MSKRIVFSTATPNDQGGVIPNEVIDFSRFNKNPVVLKEHVWESDPIGLWTDIKMENGSWSGVPMFHGLTEESKTTKDLYEGGWIRAASIGGDAIWKQNKAGQYEMDKDGNRICSKFILYEISIVTLPSNEDAVQEGAKLSAKIYSKEEIENVGASITKLSSKFNSHNMEKKDEEVKTSAPAAKEKEAVVESTKLSATATEEGHIKLSANELPGFLEKIVNIFSGKGKEKFAAPAPKDEPTSTSPGMEIVNVPQLKPTGLASENEVDSAKDKAEKAASKAKAAKEKAEKDDATEEDKAAYKKAKQEADDAMKACEAAEKKAKKAEDDDDDDDEEKKSTKEKSKNSAMKKPELKSPDELKADTKLAAKPEFQAKVRSIGNGKTFSQLAADNGEGRAILNRVMTRDAGEKHLEDYAAVLNSILADGKFAAVQDKMRVQMNVDERQLGSLHNNPQNRSGISIKEIAAQLNAGSVDMWDRSSNSMRQITTLSSTDSALAAPALNTIEWLPLALFKLFPTNSWKNEISILPASITGQNTGVIWANIAADPAIYKGNQPVTPASYSYTDTAVALSLTPYWLQPMIWTPLTMHQLRYDQMGTGWAQAFSKWGAVMDDNLIYTLASTVPAASVVLTSGISGNNAVASNFSIAGATDPNAFYYNPALAANSTFKNPVLNDIISLEQIYHKQNFNLEGERPYLIIDPTMEAIISKDPQTQSLLTRWVNADGADLRKFKHTILNERSRVAIYDPATSQVKDPNGVIPATSLSAGIGFIPSQVAMGLGMLDVFMIQDPTNYGYKMSADIRLGIAPLRADFSGTTLYTYGSGGI